MGNLRGKPGDSLVIEPEGERRGLWIDFATAESGDVLVLGTAVRGFVIPRDFEEPLDDLTDWLAVPRPTVAASGRSQVAYDELGPHSPRWDYLSVDGKLLPCVYSYDMPQGKQYRPWDVKSRTMLSLIHI